MIVVFGSLGIDMIMPVERFPKPGETILCSADHVSHPGGKGANQAVAAARGGAKVAVVGKVGDDSFGLRCINNLKNQSILASGIGTSDTHPTGYATIAVDVNGSNFSIASPGANLEATADQIPDEVLIPQNIILGQLEARPEETFALFARARARKTTTVLNASPAVNMTREGLKNVDYLIINEIEARQLAQTLGITETDPRLIAKSIVKDTALTCIITLESKGSVAVRDGNIFVVGTLKVDAVDTTGAGDAFCGFFAAGLQAGFDWLKALHYAGVGAALSCLGFGAQEGMPFLEDIEARVGEVAPPRPPA